MICYSIFVITLLVIAVVIKTSGITPCVKEHEAPVVTEPDEEKTDKPTVKVCAVTFEYRYKKAGITETLGGQFICRWVAAYRGYRIGTSSWFCDRYATAVELRQHVPYIGALMMPGLVKQQEYLDKTQDISATNYWRLIEKLEEHGWNCVYSNDGAANSMVKANLPTMEPIKPKNMDPGFSLGNTPKPPSPTETEGPSPQQVEEWRRERERLREERRRAVAHPADPAPRKTPPTDARPVLSEQPTETKADSKENQPGSEKITFHDFWHGKFERVPPEHPTGHRFLDWMNSTLRIIPPEHLASTGQSNTK